MSAPERRTFTLTDKNRQWVASAVLSALDGYRVTIEPPRRSPDQNAAFHAICADFAKALPEHAGVQMDAESWKAVLIVSHAVETGGGKVQLVPDLCSSGLVQVRESSARMSKARGSSLIDYALAEAAKRGVTITDRREAP